jgi:hypothetical protein
VEVILDRDLLLLNSSANTNISWNNFEDEWAVMTSSFDEFIPCALSKEHVQIRLHQATMLGVATVLFYAELLHFQGLMIDITKRHFRFRLGTHILKYTYYSK